VTLNPAHAAELQASCIDPAVVAERGYMSFDVEHREALLASRFPSWVAGPETSYPALFVPMYRASGGIGSAQLKPAVPAVHGSGRLMKYVSPRNSPNVLDVHPRNSDAVRDPSRDLWITEGVMKGDAMTSRGLCVVTLSGVFNWRSKLGTLGDWEDVPLKGRRIVICFDSDARGNDGVLAAMRRLGAWLTSKGAGEVLYLVVPPLVGEVAVKGVDDFFAAGGTLEQLEYTVSRTVPVNSVPADPSFTDAYLSATVADDRLDGAYLFSSGLGGWQHWDGKRWARCGTETVIDEIRRFIVESHDAVLREYSADTGSSRLKKKLDGWRSALSRSKLASLEFLARGILIADANDFDAHPDLLNVANGIVDLSTGRLLEHDPDLLMTRMASAAYRPGAEHPDWKQQLQSLPDDVHDWYQLRMGQAVTGYMVPDDVMLVQVGGGENGKSSMLDAIGRTLGDYYVQISHRALLSSNDAHPTELMDFKGARTALIEETPEERRLNATKLKQTVGTPRIKARYMRADSTEFDATHSLFLSTQFRPIVDETDHGTWRRLACLRFPIRWRKPWEPLERSEDRHGDPGLRQRMKDGETGQHEALLAWLVAGARRWYDADRVMPEHPERVKLETIAWRAECDVLTEYVSTALEFDPDGWISVSDLLTDFTYFLKDKNQQPWSDKTLTSRMQGVDALRMEKRIINTGRGHRSVRGWGSQINAGTARAWVGIKFTDR
jgi:P4 family phage/plasmid primase-like protien